MSGCGHIMCCCGAGGCFSEFCGGGDGSSNPCFPSYADSVTVFISGVGAPVDGTWDLPLTPAGDTEDCLFQTTIGGDATKLIQFSGTGTPELTYQHPVATVLFATDFEACGVIIGKTYAATIGSGSARVTGYVCH